MLDQKVEMTLSRKRAKKHVSLSETTIDAVQEFAHSEGVSFSRAIEILSLSSLSGKEQAMGLAAYLGDAVRREANQHYNRFAKLIVHAGLEAGTAKEAAQQLYFLELVKLSNGGGLEGSIGVNPDSPEGKQVIELYSKYNERSRWRSVQSLKKPLAEIHEITEEIKRLEDELQAKKTQLMGAAEADE